MHGLIVLTLVGLAAQLVDGSLGMGYGATSASLLLVAGIAPATVSASVHLAEVGTALVSGVAHWRFGNVDWRVVRRLALPGAVGAFLGATALSRLSTEAAAPVMAGVLALVGLHLLVRFASGRSRRRTGDLRTRTLAPLGAVAGFVDATGGGGWGPIATPGLLLSGRIETRKVVGSVGAAEFVVSLAATLGFLVSLGASGIALEVTLALLAGGVVAAPVAAWLVRRVPEHLLGVSVGGLLVLTNLRTALSGIELGGLDVRWPLAGLVGVAWVAAIAVAHRRHRATVPAVATA